MPVVFIEVTNAKKPEETEAEFNNRREAVAARIEKLREVFGHMTPHHWTISDELPDA